MESRLLEYFGEKNLFKSRNQVYICNAFLLEIKKRGLQYYMQQMMKLFQNR